VTLAAGLAADAAPYGSRRARARRLGRVGTAAAGPSLAVTYLSLLVLLPLGAVGAKALSGGPGAFWRAVTEPESVAALELTFGCAAGVAVVNSVAGLAVAWVLVRDRFFGKRILGALIDLPFALPTIVAGLTLLALYGPGSPFGVDVANTRAGILLALAFVTLPFCVRSVQPVLAALDREDEEAAASLGALPRTVFRRIVLPRLVPAMLAGAGLAFARAVGEFGSVVLISGNLPFKTEVASSWIYSLTQSYDFPGAAAVSVVLVAAALVVLGVIGLGRRRLERGVEV
jgi:sulfate/thiosulfate transport system permease protein